MTLQEKYNEWLQSEQGKTIAREVVGRARALRERGFDRYGVKAICESIRFDMSVRSGVDADGYKVNNNYSSRMARDLMAYFPELDGFFETRGLRA